jgi:hypothetical protein
MDTEMTWDTPKLARLILHELELELDTIPGALEGKLEYNDAVIRVLDDHLGPEKPEDETCNCSCKVCQLAHRDFVGEISEASFERRPEELEASRGMKEVVSIPKDLSSLDEIPR